MGVCGYIDKRRVFDRVSCTYCVDQAVADQCLERNIMGELFQTMLYFGQDFVEDYGTADVALDAYLTGTSTEKIRQRPVRTQRAFGQKYDGR